VTILIPPEIQLQLLPTGAREMRVSICGRLRSGARTGGDFYDFLPYGQGRLDSCSAMFPARHRRGALWFPGYRHVREIVVDHACEPAACSGF